MEIVRIIGVDPSLRTVGHAKVNYDSESNEVWVDFAGVLRCHQSIKGLDALAQMIHNVNQFAEALDPDSFDYAVIEFPAAIYNPNFSMGGMIPLAAVAGAIYSNFRKLFPDKETIMVYPAVWNSRRKKDKTAKIIQEIFGDIKEWGFTEQIKAESLYEHIIDAAAMAYWYLEKNFLEYATEASK